MNTQWNRDTFVQTESGHVYRTDARSVSSRDKILSKKEGRRLMRENALKELRETLKPGDTVHGIVRSVSRSGMSRRIDFYKLGDGAPLYLTGRIAALEGTDNFDNGLRVDGCGMDMIFASVYNLGRALWPDGFECAGEKLCRSNDHSNGSRDYSPHVHQDGGYALKSAQL